MPNVGPLEIVIVLIIVLVIFGPKRLPDLGRSLGKGMREFKDSVTGKDHDELPGEVRAGEGQRSHRAEALTIGPRAGAAHQADLAR